MQTDIRLIILAVCCTALSLRLFLIERNREKYLKKIRSSLDEMQRFDSFKMSLLKLLRKALSAKNHPVYLNGEDVEIFDLVEFVTEDGTHEEGTVNFNINPETEKLDLEHPLVISNRDDKNQIRIFKIDRITNIKLIKRILD